MKLKILIYNTKILQITPKRIHKMNLMIQN